MPARKHTLSTQHSALSSQYSALFLFGWNEDGGRVIGYADGDSAIG